MWRAARDGKVEGNGIGPDPMCSVAQSVVAMGTSRPSEAATSERTMPRVVCLSGGFAFAIGAASSTMATTTRRLRQKVKRLRGREDVARNSATTRARPMRRGRPRRVRHIDRGHSSRLAMLKTTLADAKRMH